MVKYVKITPGADGKFTVEISEAPFTNKGTTDKIYQVESNATGASDVTSSVTASSSTTSNVASTTSNVASTASNVASTASNVASTTSNVAPTTSNVAPDNSNTKVEKKDPVFEIINKNIYNIQTKDKMTEEQKNKVKKILEHFTSDTKAVDDFLQRPSSIPRIQLTENEYKQKKKEISLYIDFFEYNLNQDDFDMLKQIFESNLVDKDEYRWINLGDQSTKDLNINNLISSAKDKILSLSNLPQKDQDSKISSLLVSFYKNVYNSKIADLEERKKYVDEQVSILKNLFSKKTQTGGKQFKKISVKKNLRRRSRHGKTAHKTFRKTSR